MTKRFDKTFTFSAVAMIVLLAATAALAAGKTQSFTGTVSDAMCGAKHAMAGSATECTKACVGKGSKYALVVGDKVYTLDATEKAAMATLDKQAGANATVTGTVEGEVIHVTTVTEAK